MQVKISIVHGKEGTYTAKFATSVGGGQTGVKDASLDKIAAKLKSIVEEADENGYVGKK